MDPFTHAPKPNTRIPPILLARQSQSQSTSSKAITEPEYQYTHLATLSKAKLSTEISAPDPDLRKCVGHHRLLRRSVHEAQEDMKRYLEEVLESDSDSGEDQDEEEEEEVFDEDEDIFSGSEGEEDEIFETGPTITEKEVVPSLSTARQIRIQPPRSVPTPPLRMKEKITSAVRGLVRRRPTPTPPTSTPPLFPTNSSVISIPVPHPSHPPRSTSTPPSTQPSGSTPTPATTLRKKARDEKGEVTLETATLIRISAKNASCSDIPIKIHIHEHIAGKHRDSIQRSHSDSDSHSQHEQRVQSPPPPPPPPTQAQAQSIGLRGRKYAEKLGLRRFTSGVSAAVGVVT
ncbi:hypothetical protein BJY04DRAFT_216175 [Aspergillus karnatakaensis]|uniref:uncharacterized protein n=1 Tax=Aspergillus karnatakaensis TaxID=1810916 RepID=UPI003CCE1588